MRRIRSGKEITAIIGGMYAHIFDHDEPETTEEMNAIGVFLQNLQEWGDMWDDLESSSHVEIRFEISQQIKKLEKLGFQVFGISEQRSIRLGDKVDRWPVGIVTVVRNGNKGINELGELVSWILN